MNRGAMNFAYGSILFNRTIDDCRNIGRRGGRARARNLRRRKATQPAVVPVIEQHAVETTAQAIRRIDALFPHLRGAERHK